MARREKSRRSQHFLSCRATLVRIAEELQRTFASDYSVTNNPFYTRHHEHGEIFFTVEIEQNWKNEHPPSVTEIDP